MKYVNQLENAHVLYACNMEDTTPEREWLHHSTFDKTGCGICSALMVADRLRVDPDFTMKEALQISYDTGANHAPGTDYKLYGPAFAERFNLKLVMTSDIEEVRRCVRTGGAVVANAGGDRDGWIGVFTHGGHYVVVISETEDGRLCILDPSLKEGKFDEEGRAGKVQVCGKFAYCDPEILRKDTENRDPSFYCFWRKEG